MGLLENFKEKLDQKKEKFDQKREELATSTKSPKEQLDQKIDETIIKVKERAVKFVANTLENYSETEEALRTNIKNKKEEINARYNYPKQFLEWNRKFRKDYHLYERTGIVMCGNLYFLLFSRGLRRIRNPIFFSFLTGSFLVPELINPFNVS